jgi:hypothetical protein
VGKQSACLNQAKPPGFAFVGRDREIASLRAALQRVTTHATGAILLIRGEAGIGKTRLLEEFLQSVRPDIPILSARSADAEGAPALWLWTQILAGALSTDLPHRSGVVEAAQTLSNIYPELGFSAKKAAADLSQLDRYSVFTLWSKAIRSFGPVIISLEDIHRADADSLSLLKWLASDIGNAPILVVATHRPPAVRDQCADHLAQLASTQQCQVLDLAMLTQSEIKGMLDPTLRNREELSHALLRRTSGNPFYVTQTLRLLDSSADSNRFNSLLDGLPANGQEIVARQLCDLPESTRATLRKASVLGSRFSAHALSILCNLEISKILDDLRPAERMLLIHTSGMEYAFTHALLRDALYKTLDSAERRILHLRHARHLRAQKNSPSNAEHVAEHIAAATPLSSTKEILESAIEASNSANSRCATEAAELYLKRALDAILLDPKSSQQDYANLLLRLARTQLYGGKRGESRSTLLEVARIARLLESCELMAESALQLAPDFLSIEVGTYDTTLVRLLEEALNQTPLTNQSLRAHLLARLCQANQWATLPERSKNHAIAKEAYEFAEASKNQTAVISALSAMAETLPGPRNAAERLKLIRKLQGITRHQTPTPSLMLQHIRHVSTLLEIGDIRSLDYAITSCEDAAKELNLPQFLWYPIAFKATRAIMQGRLQVADDLGKIYVEVAARTGDRNVAASRACHLAVIHLENNRARDVLGTSSQFADQYPRVTAWRAGYAYLSLYAGNRQHAFQLLATFDESSMKSLLEETVGSAGAAFLAEIAIAASDTKRIQALYEAFTLLGDRAAILGYGIAYFGCFARYSGLLSFALGQHSEAIEHLRAAVTLETERSALIYKAHAELDLAHVLRTVGGSEEEVNDLMQSASSAADSGHLKLLQQRVATISRQYQ